MGQSPADCRSDKEPPENHSEMLETPKKDLERDRTQNAPLKKETTKQASRL